MKVIKPLRLSFLFRAFDHKRTHHLVTTVLAYFPFDSPKALLPEVELWKFIGSELGRFTVFDHCMWKPQGELLVSGACYPPGGKPEPWSYVRVSLGPIDKTLYVIGDRTWGLLGPSDPAPFTRMPVDYEHAFGGKDLPENPLGKGLAPIKTAAGTTHPLPNVEDPKNLVKSKGDRPTPASLGPWDITWPHHFAKMGTYDEKWLKDQFPGLALDVDFGVFNAAPPDQRIQGYFAGDEAFRIENMSPEKKIIEGKLPAVIARCFLKKQPEHGGELVEVPMRLDTVHLFPHVERGVLVFRGVTPISESDAADVAQALCGFEDMGGEPRPIEHYETVLAQRLDKERAHLYALRDVDLMPLSLASAPPTSAKSSPQVDPLEAVVPMEGLLRKNARNRMERELDAAKDKIKSAGLDPGDFPNLKLPPQEDTETPDLDKLAEYVDKLTAQAKEHEAEGKRRREEQEKKLREMCEKGGVSFDEVMKKSKDAGSGPPKFTADAELERLRDMAQLAANAETEIPGVNEMLSDPTFEGRLREAEAKLHEGYRMTAHFQPGAPRMEAAENERVRREIMRAYVRGDGLARRDLTGVDLSGLNLQGVDLAGAYLESANLSGADLTGANLRDAVLAKANLTGAKLAWARLTKANLGRANLRNAEMRNVDLCEAVLYEADLRGATLAGARLTGAQLLEVLVADTDMSGVQAEKLIFLRTRLTGVRFAGAKLHQCCFIEADVSDVDFSGADLTGTAFLKTVGDGAVFTGATLENLRLVQRCSFEGATFSGAQMTGSNARGARLAGSDFTMANMRRSDFSEADLSGATFYRANAIDCRFMRSNLASAKMVAANMMLAVLQNANLRGADFSGANLFAADLTASVGDDVTSFEGANVKRVVVSGGSNAKG